MMDYKLQEYTFYKEIGRGASGCVWLAKSSKDIYCAIKVVDKVSIGEEAYTREVRGISTYGRLPWYSGLVPVFDFWEDSQNARFYSVMAVADDEMTGRDINPETYRPKTLSSLISSNVALPMVQCISMARVLLNALEYLQKNHLIHRDIKLGNILIINDQPVLTDFGLAIDFREANSIVGTPGYVPPENHGTVQGDIYSLGKLLYTISTGRNAEEFGYAPRAEADIDSPLFSSWMNIVNKACAPRLPERYFSPREMLQDIESMLTPQEKKSPRFLILLCVVGVLVLGFFLLYKYFPIGADKPANMQKEEPETVVYDGIAVTKEKAKEIEAVKERSKKMVSEINQQMNDVVSSINESLSSVKKDREARDRKLKEILKEREQEKKKTEEGIVAPQTKIEDNSILELINGMVLLPSGLYMSKYETTQSQWEAVMGENPSEYKGENRPVECVSWNEIQIFIQRLNDFPEVKNSGFVFRLPTLQEWQYACAAGSTGDYGFISKDKQGAFDDVAWHRYNSGRHTHDVGLKTPNLWGLYDMHGNLWEFTSTIIDGNVRVGGGCWGNSYYFCRTMATEKNQKTDSNSSTGFRLAASKK